MFLAMFLGFQRNNKPLRIQEYISCRSEYVKRFLVMVILINSQLQLKRFIFLNIYGLNTLRWLTNILHYEYCIVIVQ
jgi:hypothetical protein